MKLVTYGNAAVLTPSSSAGQEQDTAQIRIMSAVPTVPPKKPRY
jgi:hypothetical protein